MARVYKESLPLATISKIRNILSDLSIFTYESVWCNPYSNIYSTRVECDVTDGGFGTNGKGRDRQYTLASAYAEFIERLQNGYISGVYGFNRFFLKQIKQKVGFYYYPDEKIISELEFRNLPEAYLNDLFSKQDNNERDNQISAYFNRVRKNGEDGVVAVPFYSPTLDKIVYLPYNLTLTLTGSNGMAAGNSAAEGVFQALCEIIERYAASQVFYNRLTPPTISTNFLARFPEELSIIKDIESSGYIVNVLDFSAGLNLPAVGVIVYNSNKTLYKLNVGAETSFKIALSRALTEVHQGLKNKKEFDERMMSVPEKEYDYFLEDNEQSRLLRSIQIRKFIIDGSGAFPKSLFQSISSYSFNENIFGVADSYADEVNRLVNLFSKLGFDVFIRDVSFLGFPSYYVFVPNVSIFGRKTYEDASNTMTLIDTIEQDAIEDLFFPTTEFIHNKDIIFKLGNAIAPNREETFKNVMMQEILKLKFDNHHYWSQIPVSYFLTLFCFAIGEYCNAIKYMKLFMEETGNSNDEYYLEILSYFSLLRNGDTGKIQTEISSEILQEFSNTQTLFSNILLPNCPNCDDCLLKDNCQTKPNFKNSLKFAEKMNRQIAQIELRNLFR
ncbi:MAG: YcaO-like family protein [Lepagella sp.]